MATGQENLLVRIAPPRRESTAQGPPEAFIIGTEFAHIHPLPDGSLHAALPPALAEEAITAGRGRDSPRRPPWLIPMNIVMLYAPRDAAELNVVLGLLRAGYELARAETAEP